MATGIFIANFELFLRIVLVFPFSTLNKYVAAM